MKKSMLALGLAASLALGGVAMAAGGSQADPLISLQYLTGSYLNSLRSTVETAVSQGTLDVYQAAKNRLDQLAQSYLNQQGGQTGGDIQWVTSASFQSLSGEKGDTVVLDTGAGLLWISGSAAASGVLVDATEGQELAAGDELTPGHRYLAAEQSTVTFSSEAQCAVEGRYTTTADGAQPDDPDDFPFTDVPDGTWYTDAVHYVVENGLFNGTGETTFEPLTYTMRSMLTTVLYRLAGEPNVTYTDLFEDVENGMWYSQSVIWAAENNVVTGDGAGHFYPLWNITRQEIA